MVASGVIGVEGGILKEKLDYIPTLSMSNKKKGVGLKKK